MNLTDVFERISDHLNAVHIREVRQELRGRGFRNSFWFTICVATVIGVAVIAVNDAAGGEVGRFLFVAAFACLAFATSVIIPFTAFNAVGAEWDEKTQDLLVLSNLRPHQIVAGKFLSAMTQALLYYSALVPFLVFAYLLRGLDIGAIALSLWTSFTQCCMLTIGAISLSSLARNKALRVLMTAGLVIFLLSFMGSFFAASVMTTIGGLGVGVTGATTMVVMDLLVKGTFGVFAFAIACTRFAHPEENRSTLLRVLVLLFAYGSIGLNLLFPDLRHGSFGIGGTRRLDPEVYLPALSVLLLGSLFFMTEKETLGRRVRAHVPTRFGFVALLTPLYPGGGRGVAYYTIHALLILWIVGLVNAMSGGSIDGSFLVANYAFLYSLIFFCLPFGLLSRLTVTLSGRVAVLLIGVAFLLISTAISIFATFMTGAGLNDPRPWDVLNPIVILQRVYRNQAGDLGFETAVILVAALASVVVNLPRVTRGFAEIRLASRARREKERAALEEAAAPVPDPVGVLSE